MTGFLLVRDGDTEWTEAQRYQGHADLELSPKGRKQAKSLRDRLHAEPINAIYSSPLRRARITAEIIASCHKPKVQIHQDLMERQFSVEVAELNYYLGCSKLESVYFCIL